MNIVPITKRNVSENVCIKMACLMHLHKKLRGGEISERKWNCRKSPWNTPFSTKKLGSGLIWTCRQHSGHWQMVHSGRSLKPAYSPRLSSPEIPTAAAIGCPMAYLYVGLLCYSAWGNWCSAFASQFSLSGRPVQCWRGLLLQSWLGTRLTSDMLLKLRHLGMMAGQLFFLDWLSWCLSVSIKTLGSLTRRLSIEAFLC